MMHSGLQFGGEPMYPPLQEHMGRSLRGLQEEYGPQGDGMQGLEGLGGGVTVAKTKHALSIMNVRKPLIGLHRRF